MNQEKAIKAQGEYIEDVKGSAEEYGGVEHMTLGRGWYAQQDPTQEEILEYERQAGMSVANQVASNILESLSSIEGLTSEKVIFENEPEILAMIESLSDTEEMADIAWHALPRALDSQLKSPVPQDMRGISQGPYNNEEDDYILNLDISPEEAEEGMAEMMKVFKPNARLRAVEDEASHAKNLKKMLNTQAVSKFSPAVAAKMIALGIKAISVGRLSQILREAPGPFGEEPGITGDPSPKNRRSISTPPGAPSRGRGRGQGYPPQGAGGMEVCVCPISGKEYPKERGKPCYEMDNPDHPDVRLIGKPKAEQIPPAPSKSTKGNIPQGRPEVLSPSQRKFACNVYTYADQLITKVQEGIITASDATKELNTVAKEYGWNAAQKKYVKERLKGKVASTTTRSVPGTGPPTFPFEDGDTSGRAEASDDSNIARDASTGGVPTQLALCYNAEEEAYSLYDLDFGPVSADGAKEKDIRGQLQSFRVNDAQITEALKDAKQGEVLIRIGMDVVEAIECSVDAALSGTNSISGTQLVAPNQAPRGILMQAALDELQKILGTDLARTYKKDLKKALSKRLEAEPRQEYDGHREFPQKGLTIPAKKVARTYEGTEKKEKVDAFAKQGIPLKLMVEPKSREIPNTPPDRQLNAIARLQFGDWIRDKVHPEFTGVVVGFEGDNFVRVAMDKTAYCEAGSESMYLIDGVTKRAQEAEFEDFEKTEKTKRFIHSLLQEDKRDLFWDEPEGK